MDEEVVIKVDGVSKDFSLTSARANTIKNLLTGFHREKRTEKNTQHALKNISFEIRKGEFFGIVGRNGSGKSTLLKMLAGIYQPTEGDVFSKGKLVPFIELGVGFNPELTGRENVYMNGALLGFSESEVDTFYQEVVEFAELEKFMDKKLKNYSSGMQVRLAFSMAIRANADILLIDEVLAVGDADFQRKCYDYFRSLKKNKKTVVFVSHDMGAVREFCDRAALIEQSKLEMIGDTSKIADEYTNLFLKSTSHEDSLSSFNTERRMGSGEARIREASLSKTTFSDTDKSIELNVRVEAFEKNKDLLIGFAIKNSAGQFINSTHTAEIQRDLKVAPGENCEVKWVFPNIYEDGSYTVDLYSYGENHSVYDSLNDALSFKIKRRIRTGALVVIPGEVTIKTVSKKR